MLYRSLIICSALAITGAASAQQARPESGQFLRQHVVQSCLNIRGVIMQSVALGQNDDIKDLDSRSQREVQEQIFNSTIEGFSDPDMIELLTDVTRNYRRTNRESELTRALNDDEQFLIPCTTIELKRFQKLSENMGLITPETQYRRTSPPRNEGNSRSLPEWMEEPPQADRSGQPEKQANESPKNTYGTSRR